MPSRGAARMTRRAASAPARWPAERGRPREVAQRPLPSEMMATWRRGAGRVSGRTEEICWTAIDCMVMFFLRRGENTANYSTIQSEKPKKFPRSALPRGADQRLHVIEVPLEGPPPRRGQAILGFGQAAGERFLAQDVVSFFQLAGVNAQITVGRFQQSFELVEGQRAIDGQRADNSQADALMNETV